MRLADKISVSLSKQKTKGFEYWCLRWFGGYNPETGKIIHRGEIIGRADGPNKISKDEATVLKARKLIELKDNPGRRDAAAADSLESYLEWYIASRTEIAPSTLYLHRLTVKYLLEYFGRERRIDRISRVEARDFKTALARGELKHINKRKQDLKAASVDLHIRNARTIFNYAVKVDTLTFNPFDRLCTKVKIEKNWHYVNFGEFKKLFDAAPDMNWRLVLALCRLAGLRRGEAVNLEWSDIDWQGSKLQIIGKEDWQPKDKESRIIPICPELQKILLFAYENAAEGQRRVIDSFPVTNTWKGFKSLCKAACVDLYKKPFHTLRKNCITDWAAIHPAHVVQEWAGHSSLETTNQYYLQVSECEYNKASEKPFFGAFAQLFCTTDGNKKVDEGKKSGIVL